MDAEAIRMLAAGLAMGLGAIGPGIGIGILGYGAMQALGRNPEARGPIGHRLRRSYRHICSYSGHSNCG